ncbi:hypothetical protein G9A89_009925 [Geosiphon pyriformis]|nr:hypothetical protein G9A89_009925 [Geosiphon pyriformis]
MEIAHYLNALIENKWFTPISTYSYTGFLDETFGFQVQRLAGYIIINEISINSEYVVWFRQFGKPAALFTILSAADIDALNLLHSKYTNLGIFSAPISKRLEDLIFWGSTINIFIEGIPQFVIQVMYQQNTIAYEIIPIMSLIMSSVILTINIIIRFYSALIWFRDQTTFSRVEREETNEFDLINTGLN